jgi:hypothetical protein
VRLITHPGHTTPDKQNHKSLRHRSLPGAGADLEALSGWTVLGTAVLPEFRGQVVEIVLLP